MTSSFCFSESVYKTCQWQPTELKLGKLIAHVKFHKICKFENHVTRNDVIMTSLPKQWKVRTSAKPNKLYIIRKVLMRAIQKCTFYWNWVTMSKVMGIYVKFWHFLRCPLSKYGHVTWPKKQISEKFYFFLNSAFNIGKSCKISSRKAFYFRSYQPKTSRGGGWKTPPLSAFRVNINKALSKNFLVRNLLFQPEHSLSITRSRIFLTERLRESWLYFILSRDFPFTFLTQFSFIELLCSY